MATAWPRSMACEQGPQLDQYALFRDLDDDLWALLLTSIRRLFHGIRAFLPTGTPGAGRPTRALERSERHPPAMSAKASTGSCARATNVIRVDHSPPLVCSTLDAGGVA